MISLSRCSLLAQTDGLRTVCSFSTILLKVWSTQPGSFCSQDFSISLACPVVCDPAVCLVDKRHNQLPVSCEKICECVVAHIPHSHPVTVPMLAKSSQIRTTISTYYLLPYHFSCILQLICNTSQAKEELHYSRKSTSKCSDPPCEISNDILPRSFGIHVIFPSFDTSIERTIIQRI